MKLPARFASMVALAVTAGEPALATASSAVQQPATVSEIGQFFNERQGRPFWFASDHAAEALLAPLEQASFDDLDPSLYPSPHCAA